MLLIPGDRVLCTDGYDSNPEIVGMQGTIRGIHYQPRHLEVLYVVEFDRTFLRGYNPDGLAPSNCGWRIPERCLAVLSTKDPIAETFAEFIRKIEQQESPHDVSHR